MLCFALCAVQAQPSLAQRSPSPGTMGSSPGAVQGGGNGAISNPNAVFPQAPSGVVGTPPIQSPLMPSPTPPVNQPIISPVAPLQTPTPGVGAPPNWGNGVSPWFPLVPGSGAAGTRPGTGQFPTGSELNPTQQQTDQSLINNQAADFQKRYLSGEVIELQMPRPAQLLPLGTALPPIRLEASYTEPVSLRSCLTYAIDHNLAIGIQEANKVAQFWTTFGAYGGFLPNMIMNFQHQLLSGQSLIGGIIPVQYHTPNTTAQAGFQYYGFQGGAILFNAIGQTHAYKASKAQVKGTINDTLLAVARSYYNMINNQALLQIQTRAVEVSRAQVALNKQLESVGTGTRFQVLQAETQLARDEQNLLTQEVLLRNSSIDLATTMNLNSAVNFLSVEGEVRKIRLVDPALDINKLIALAILNRPELKQYEELRIAARRAIQVAAAPLYPQFQFFGNVFGNGATLGDSFVQQPPSATIVPAAGPAPGAPILLPAAPGAATIGNNPATAGVSTVTGAAALISPGTLVNRDMRTSYSLGIRLDWNFPSLGVPTMASVMTAKAQARAAMLNSNQQLLYILQQVRESYLNSQTAERQIEVADKGVISSAEELRLARVRLANGVGTNIDVINAQRDFISALVQKANAIVQFNISQAQLVHDLGVISVDSLTSGKLVRQ